MVPYLRSVRTVAAVLTMALLLAACGGSDNVAKSKPTLVALGDSYISGEGVAPYEAGTDTPTDKCHRSTQAYGVVAATKAGYQARSVACSGARLASILAEGAGEPAQAGRIDNADVALVSIGGNDVSALSALITDTTFETLQGSFDNLKPQLTEVLKRIKTDSSKTRFYLVDYPNIVPANTTPGCPFDAPRIALLNKAAAALDDTLSAAATDAGVGFIDVRNAFDGHQLCTAQPWVKGLDPINPSGSLHPNAAGQMQLATVVADRLPKV